MSAIAWTIVLLFFPASLGILTQAVWGNDLSRQVLAVATLLLCADQARMAIVDFEQIAAVKQQVQDSRVAHFYRITVSTIVLELLGFYSASIWLGWGSVLVLLSQVWFHLLAGVQLHPAAEVAIQPKGISERFLVLAADGVGLVLVGLWLLQVASLWVATILLLMVILYGVVKYSPSLPTS